MRWIKAIQRSISLIAITLLLCSCAAPSARVQQYVPLPGDAQFYSYGVSQSKENFSNIARAQSDYTLYPERRTWSDDKPGMAPGTMGMLRIYYPLHVRWELKDGRQFILEDIDVATIMRKYFEANRLELQHQRERRKRDLVGDYSPSFVHELRDDRLILKWLITTNNTPVNERLNPNGSANRWRLTTEEFLVTEIQGLPTSGIDFENKWEFGRTQQSKN